MTNTILFLSDIDSICIVADSLTRPLVKDLGCQIEKTSSLAVTADKLKRHEIDIIIIFGPAACYEGVLQELREIDENIPIIFISTYGEVPELENIHVLRASVLPSKLAIVVADILRDRLKKELRELQ